MKWPLTPALGLICTTVPWRSGSPASGPRSAAAGKTVSSLLEASRREQHRSRRGPAQSTQAYANDSINPGLLFHDTEERQLAALHRLRTAGPVPHSWTKDILAQKRDTQKRNSTRQAQQLEGRVRESRATRHCVAATLREECLARFLIDMSLGGPLLDDVAFLPMHLKSLLINMAPDVAPLDDASAYALLLEAEDDNLDIPSDGLHEQTNDADWEASIDGEEVSHERLIESLDLSRSKISMSTLRRIISSSDHRGSTFARLPVLKALKLSYSQFTISHSLTSALAGLPIRDLSLAGLDTNLYLPLQSLALALPTLQHLDISDSEWLEWSHLSKLDWKMMFQELRSLNISRCCRLSPNATHMNPEGHPEGSAILVQAMSVIRDAGRTKWLDIAA